MTGGGDRLELRARGLIGDTRTAALVAADGTIDWYCPGRFDAPASLFRLLDPGGGAVRVGLAGLPRAGTQRYEPATNLLITTLAGADGEIEILDFMPVQPGFTPPGRIVRVVTARRGPVTVEVDVVPGYRFGSAQRVHAFAAGIAFDGLVVRTPAPFEGRTARFVLDSGERAVITIDTTAVASAPLTLDGAFDLAARTADGWRRGLAATTYEGPYAAAVERSLLTLGLLTTAGGAVVASPTTSLPQRVGGERNWDGRYAWARDTAAAVTLLAGLGLAGTAERVAAFVVATLRATTPLRGAYTVDGEPLAEEEHELPLAGWRRSQPVRESNAAGGRIPIDVYRGVFGAVDDQLLNRSHPLAEAWPDLAEAADWLAENWSNADAGRFDLRGEPRHIVASKLDAWWALDHLGRLGQRRQPLDLQPAGWRLAAADAMRWIDANATAPGGHLRHAGSRDEEPDAALLAALRNGPWPSDHPTVTLTVDRILRVLGEGPFLHRYAPDLDDGLPPGQGACVASSFEAASSLATMERWEEAHERMDALVAFAGPLGLLPEQADPISRDFLGNMPAAASHLALLDAARALTRGPR